MLRVIVVVVVIKPPAMVLVEWLIIAIVHCIVQEPSMTIVVVVELSSISRCYVLHKQCLTYSD